MRSGYGFYIRYRPKMVSVSGCEAAPEGAYTDVQRVEIAFPEFNYSHVSIFMRTLQQVEGVWAFARNLHADGQERLHFTPLWYPNGYYTVQVMAKEVWTPAGMIYCSINSNTIQIVDSAYDDWYVGEG